MRPVTDQQWQDAFDAAYTLIHLELGRLFQLCKHIPDVDIEECTMLLAEGRARGIFPRAELTELVRAAEAMLEKCEEEKRVLQGDNWLGRELRRLRSATNKNLKGVVRIETGR